MDDPLAQRYLLDFQRGNAALQRCQHRRGLDLYDALQQLVGLPLHDDQLRLQMGALFLLPAQASIPDVLEHRSGHLEELTRRLEPAHQSGELAFELVAANHLAAACTSLGHAVVVRVLLGVPLTPTCRQWAVALGTCNEAAQWEVLVQVLPRGYVCHLVHALLNLLIGLEGNQRLVSSLAKGYTHSLTLDVAGVCHPRQDVLNLLPTYLSAAHARKLGKLLKEASHFCFELEASTRIALKTLSHDCGERFIRYKHLAAVGATPIAVANRTGEHVVAVQHPCAAPVARLLRILLAMVLAHAREQVFNQLRVRVFTEFNAGRKQLGAGFADCRAKAQVRIEAASQAAQVVDDDAQVLSAMLAQILEHLLHSWAVNAGAGLAILKCLYDLQAFVLCKLTATCCLRAKPIAL